jgi:hypothetical protein
MQKRNLDVYKITMICKKYLEAAINLIVCKKWQVNKGAAVELWILPMR